MNDFAQFLLQIQQDLQSAGVDWCLIGGLAVAARGRELAQELKSAEMEFCKH